MEPISILIVSLIVAAFVIFGAVLAYAERITRMTRPARELAARQEVAKVEIEGELHKAA